MAFAVNLPIIAFTIHHRAECEMPFKIKTLKKQI